MEETKQHHEALIQGRDESLKAADERVAALETKLNERLEDNRPRQEDQTNDDLENECSELKEKLESLLKELSKVKQENQELVQSQAKHHQDEVDRLRGEVEAHKQAIQVLTALHPSFLDTHNFTNTVMQFFLVCQTIPKLIVIT